MRWTVKTADLILNYLNFENKPFKISHIIFKQNMFSLKSFKKAKPAQVKLDLTSVLKIHSKPTPQLDDFESMMNKNTNKSRFFILNLGNRN